MPNWNEVLNEIKKERETNIKNAASAVDSIRRRYLLSLHEHTGRNVIAYYSGWLSKPGIRQAGINDEDKNGFMMAIHQLDRSKGLDLILHTPGGDIAATQSIVDYLHKMFDNDIRAIVPQIAMSAGTMIACACKEIWMAKHSNLGPIDPQLDGDPAEGILQEFDRACSEVAQDPSRIPIWQMIIAQYQPTILGQAKNAIDWSKAFVEQQLADHMFRGLKTADKKARRIVRKLTDYSANKTHSRHINADECHAMGLRVKRIESKPEFQDLVLTVHHCFMHSLQNTSAFKAIENHNGVAWIKNVGGQPTPVPSST